MPVTRSHKAKSITSGTVNTSEATTGTTTTYGTTDATGTTESTEATFTSGTATESTPEKPGAVMPPPPPQGTSLPPPPGTFLPPPPPGTILPPPQGESLPPPRHRTSPAPSVASRSTAASARRRELLRAREELMQKEVELARARIAVLEAESDEDFEIEETVKNQRTSEWVNRSTLAIAETPYQPPAAEGNAPLPGPVPCPEVHHRQDRGCVLTAGALGLDKPLPPPTPQHRNDYSELAAAITFAARSAAQQHPAIAPPPRILELPTFNGASSDWLPFKAAYEETAGQLSEQENLSRLRRCLKGIAREAVQCLFIGSTSSASVMKMLESRFGRPDALVAAEMNKLRALPRLSENPRDICIYASRVMNVTAAVQALKKPHYLFNGEVVRSVVEKLPPALRYRYYDYAAEQPEVQADLITLTQFLTITAERCGSFAPVEVVAAEDRREAATRRTVRAYKVEEPRKQSQPEKCPLCKGDHKPADCGELKRVAVSERWDLAKKHRLCFRCLRVRKFRHSCKGRRCDIDGCTYLHHQLLHSQSAEVVGTNQTEDMPSAVIASAKDTTSALLKIIPVEVSGPLGSIETFALLDDGSTCTLIDADTVIKIGTTGPAEPFRIEGVAGAKIEALQSRRVNFSIKGSSGRTFKISGRTMENLQLSPQTLPRDVITGCSHLQGLEEQLVYNVGQPTILLGQDNWHLLLTLESRCGTRDQPVASLTELGWVLHGNTRRSARAEQVFRISHTIVSNQEEDSIEALMREHFALESLGVEPRRSFNPDERRALEILEQTTQCLPDGRFETGLLWKRDDISPPDSYDVAYRRLLLVEKKLDRDAELKTRYEAQINTMLSNNFAEIAPSIKPSSTWYLPHFAVINPLKPGKLRIVHDAAAKSRGVSLNDMLLSGPDLLQSLPGILMRFRQRPVAVTSDIKDMFLRISIRQEDRDMQRFLWRGDRREGPPTEYRMKSVIFGATSSPSTAIFVKNKNAERFASTYPEAADLIVRGHYMDDYIASFDTEEEAWKISEQVAHIHSAGNFHLHKWASNSATVRRRLNPEATAGIVELAPEKILGMVWNTESDSLSFNTNLTKVPTALIEGHKAPTKREALKTVMSLYDPLGLATPVTIQAKRILQDTWRSGIGWDEQLQPAEAELWDTWVRNIKKMGQLVIPRCHPSLSLAQTTEIHTFVDASSLAYAAAVYWRVIIAGAPQVSLIVAKGRVAPLKIVSIPRLELQAAVLGCRLAQTAIEEHDFRPTRRVFWSDSSTVLTWLRTGPRKYKPFVAHRVAEIGENTKTNEWRWVPTKLNVADDATRMIPHDFGSQHRWFSGPGFLRLPEEEWPHENFKEEHETGEERVTVVRTQPHLINALPDITKFSSWIRLIRSTARVLQFIDLLRLKTEKSLATRKRTKKNPEADPEWRCLPKAARKIDVRIPKGQPRKTMCLPAEYLQRAETLWVRAVQEQCFGREVDMLQRAEAIPGDSRLRLLSVKLSDDGTLRLKSRIAAAQDITASQREPAILDGSHSWTRLYISWTHTRLHHGGFEITTNEVRQHYWVLRLRATVQSTIKRCLVCRIRKAKPAWPSTGDHPISRLAHHRRAFTYTGVDYFGPLAVTVGRTQQKRYGALFTCLTTRAVHLELAGSLSTDSAIMALRRFIGRRGCPTEIWSDQGTNLRGADSELRKMAQEAAMEEASVRSIKWRYIPPSAPFMGGAWERLVRSVKTALSSTLHQRAPREEVLTTLLIEAEHTINSRPLTHVSTSPDDEEALTPNHFLLGGPSRVPVPGTFVEGDEACRKDWVVSQRLADVFWARWVREYLPELQHRREPQSRGAIKIGDLVLIADGTLPRNVWPRGRVVAAYPGPDDETRAVDVRTSRGILRRPTKKLIVLPVEREHEDQQLEAAAGENVRDKHVD